MEGFRHGELQRKWGTLGSQKLREQGNFGNLGKYITWEIQGSWEL
jgi:hypothetical protein